MLRTLDKFFKTDTKYILTNSSYLGISQILGLIFIFLSSVAFANLLDKESYGQYQYVLTIIEFIFIPSLAVGFGRSIIRSTAKGYDGSLTQSFKQNILWALPATFFGLIVSFYYLLNHDLILGLGVLFLVTTNPFLLSGRLHGGFLSGKKLFFHLSVFSFITVALPTLALVLTLFISQNILALIIVYGISHTLVNLFAFFYCLRLVENDKTSPDTLSQAKHLSLINLIPAGVGQLDKLLLFQFIGPVALAEYIFSTALPKQLQYVNKKLRSIALPKFSDRTIEELKKSVPRKIFYLYFLVIPLIISYIVSAPFIFSLFFPQYVDVVIYSQIYSLILLVSPLNFLYDVFTSHNINKPVYYIDIFSSIAQLVSTLILIPPFGVMGLLMARLTVNFLRGMLIIYYFNRI